MKIYRDLENELVQKTEHTNVVELMGSDNAIKIYEIIAENELWGY